MVHELLGGLSGLPNAVPAPVRSRSTSRSSSATSSSCTDHSTSYRNAGLTEEECNTSIFQSTDCEVSVRSGDTCRTDESDAGQPCSSSHHGQSCPKGLDHRPFPGRSETQVTSRQQRKLLKLGAPKSRISKMTRLLNSIRRLLRRLKKRSVSDPQDSVKGSESDSGPGASVSVQCRESEIARPILPREHSVRTINDRTHTQNKNGDRPIKQPYLVSGKKRRRRKNQKTEDQAPSFTRVEIKPSNKLSVTNNINEESEEINEESTQLLETNNTDPTPNVPVPSIQSDQSNQLQPTPLTGHTNLKSWRGYYPKFRLWRQFSVPAVKVSRSSCSEHKLTRPVYSLLTPSGFLEQTQSDLVDNSLAEQGSLQYYTFSTESSRPGSANHSRTGSLEGSRSGILSITTDLKEDDSILRPLSICTASCRYDVVRRVSKRFGMKDVSEDEHWNLFWTDLSISLDRCKDMKRFQKINHFPGMVEICRKDLLARNLNRMFRLFPKDYNFFPKTWCLPADLGDLSAYARTRRNRTFILKPDTGCQGKGIYLTKNVKDLKPHTRMICQVYISKPFLVDGFKFDMRVYTLITSCDPLRIFVYNDGLVRFATSPYHEPNNHNTANVFMHLTNYAVNKHSRMFVVDDEAGSKRKISTLNKWLESKNYDVGEVWTRVDELIVKTLISALPVIRHNYHACFPAHDFTYACFELLGFDILLDHKLKPYILEVNHSPSFHTDAQIDREVKETLLMDTFGILNLSQYDKRKVMEEDRRRVRDRLLQSIAHKDGSECSMPSSVDTPWKAQFEWEDNNMGNFRRVYPCDPPFPDKYEAFFHQNQSSLFQETAASRAREEASRLQRDLYEHSSLYKQVAVELAHEEARRLRQRLTAQVKQKEEEARRPMSLARRREYERLRPESPMTGRRTRNFAQRLKRNMTQQLGTAKKLPARYVLNSFLPEAISESEESIRAAALAERSLLIQSKGIVQLIYQMLKENKNLCAEDLRKYAAHGIDTPGRKEDDKDAANANKLPSLLTLIQKTTGQAQVDVQRNKVQVPLESYDSASCGAAGAANCAAENVRAAHLNGGELLPIQLPNGNIIPGLGVMCAEAPFWIRSVRSGLRPEVWTSEALSTPQIPQAHVVRPIRDPRITRSTMGRLVSSALKLNNLEKRQVKPQAL